MKNHASFFLYILFLTLCCSVRYNHNKTLLIERLRCWRGVSYRCVCVFILTKVFSAPDVHCRVVLPQMIEPGSVDHKKPACDDRRPDTPKHKKERKKERKKNCFHLVPLTIIHLSCLNLRTTDYRSYFKHQSTTDAAFCVILWPIFCSCN